VVLGELGNFPLWGVDLKHCVGGFGWFWVVLGGFGGLKQFSFMGS
jgi:hypothetical protein